MFLIRSRRAASKIVRAYDVVPENHGIGGFARCRYRSKMDDGIEAGVPVIDARQTLVRLAEIGEVELNEGAERLRWRRSVEVHHRIAVLQQVLDSAPPSFPASARHRHPLHADLLYWVLT